MFAPLSGDEIAELGRLSRHVFGENCRVVEQRVVLRRQDYLVILAELATPSYRVAIKLAGPGAPIASSFDRTAAILRRVRDETAVPIPDVLSCDVSRHDFPHRYLMTTQLPGVPWHEARRSWSQEEQAELWRQLGDAVAGLHALRYPAYGEIGLDGAVVGEDGYVAALARRAGRRIADPRHVALFREVLASWAAAFAEVDGPCLDHEDLNPTNLLVERDKATGRWRLSGILDFDSAWAGCAESDLARLALWEGMAGPAFWAGYGRAEALTSGERERRLVLQLLWCLEYARPTARHHEDTARVCAGLGIGAVRFG